jgi:hypothetical protein
VPGQPLCRPEERAACYFPRDLFFCFFTFKLTMGAFTPVPRETGLGAGCFFDFPAMLILLEATDDHTLQAIGGSPIPAVRLLAERSRHHTSTRGVGWLDWPCGQNTGRNPEGRQRASCARDDGASANRVRVQGQYPFQATYATPEHLEPDRAQDSVISRHEHLTFAVELEATARRALPTYSDSRIGDAGRGGALSSRPRHVHADRRLGAPQSLRRDPRAAIR